MDMFDSPLESNGQNLTLMKRQPPAPAHPPPQHLIHESSCLSSLVFLFFLILKKGDTNKCILNHEKKLNNINVNLVLE